MNKIPEFIKIIIGVFLTFIACVALVYIVVISIGLSGVYYEVENDDLLKPTIKKGEFPLIITLEINGEQHIIQDTVVCKFKGIRTFGLGEKSREWEAYLESSGKEPPFLADLEGLGIFDPSGQQLLYLYLFCGDAEYYMGEHITERHGPMPVEEAYYYLQDTEGNLSSKPMLAKEVYENFGVRLISLECSPPIKNTFK